MLIATSLFIILHKTRFMKKWVYLTVLVLSIAIRTSAQNEDPRFVDGKLYFRLKLADTTLSLNSPALLPLVALYHMNACYRPFAGLGSDSLDRTYCLLFSDTAKTKLCMDTLRSLPIVDAVEQVPIYHTNYVPNDVNSNQWGLLKINAENAWNISKGSASVVVAVVDNGILNTHQDLAANMVAGFDVADNDNNPAPPSGFTGGGWNHGTHTSGIVSAVTDNGIGIASIGFNTKVMPVKCTNDTSKTGNDLEFADEGITYAMQHGAKVISMSFGSYQSSFTEQALVSTAINQGIVLVAAAGNNDSTGLLYPASYTGVISVGASDQNDVKCSFSNYGSRIDVMAPGLSIYSTFATSTSAYGTLSGTSMSTPLVAGLAALVLAQNPSFTPAQVLNAIKSSADNISSENSGFNGQLGAGRINAFHALGGVGPGTGTGIDELASLQAINIYPNPVNTNMTISLTNTQSATIQLTDLQGKLVINKEVSGQLNPEIETSLLPDGVYVVRIITNAGIISRKVIKM